MSSSKTWNESFEKQEALEMWLKATETELQAHPFEHSSYFRDARHMFRRRMNNSPYEEQGTAYDPGARGYELQGRRTK